jgi:hypothetical protein
VEKESGSMKELQRSDNSHGDLVQRIWVGKKISQRPYGAFRVSATVNGVSTTRTAPTLAKAEKLQALLASGVIPEAQREVRTLSRAELEQYRADERYEEHHGLEDFRACRICGVCLANLGRIKGAGHIVEEGFNSVSQYRDHCRKQGWGKPPTLSPRALKSTLAIVRKRRATNPEKVKEETEKAAANARHRYLTDQQFRERTLEKNRRTQGKRRATLFGTELLQCPYCPKLFRTLRKHTRDRHPEQQSDPEPMIVPELGAQQFARLEKGKREAFERKMAKVAALETQLANAKLELAKLEDKLRRPHRRKLEEEKKAAQVGPLVEDAIPRFTQIVAEYKALPKPIQHSYLGLKKRLDAKGYTATEVEAAWQCRFHTGKVAARHFVANTSGDTYESVKHAHLRYEKRAK